MDAEDGDSDDADDRCGYPFGLRRRRRSVVGVALECAVPRQTHRSDLALMRTGRPRSQETVAEKLRRIVSAGPADACWLWTRARDPWGYGQFWDHISRRTVQASRVAFEVEYGPVPQGLYVCHRCDNPACINPEHLFIGTSRDNKLDSVRKGRARLFTPETSRAALACRGRQV